MSLCNLRIQGFPGGYQPQRGGFKPIILVISTKLHIIEKNWTGGGRICNCLELIFAGIFQIHANPVFLHDWSFHVVITSTCFFISGLRFMVTCCVTSCNGLINVILRFTEHPTLFRSVTHVIRVSPEVFHETAHKGTLVPERGPLCNPSCLFFTDRQLCFISPTINIIFPSISLSLCLLYKLICIYGDIITLNHPRFLRKMILF